MEVFRVKKIKAFVLFLLFVACHIYSQDIFKKIDKSNGLSNSSINTIIKEKNGFFWFGTQNGLNRFDGSEIKVYNKHNSSLESNDILDILQDNKGRIVVSTNGGGFAIYDKEKDDFKVYKDIVDKDSRTISNQLNVILEDSNGVFWLGTEKGLASFNLADKECVHYTYGSNNTNITAIYEDTSNNKLWVGANEGLILFDRNTGTFEKVISPNPGSPKFIKAISELNANQMLIGTFGMGLLLIDKESYEVSNFFENNASFKEKIKTVRSIVKDNNGDLWIGTNSLGLIHVVNPNEEKPTIKNFMFSPQIKNSLSGNSVNEIFVDEDSNVWIGTAWNGINVLDTKKTTELLYSDISGLNPSPVLSIFKKDNKLLLGLDGNGFSINNYVTGTSQDLNKGAFSQIKFVQKISNPDRGNIWLGTFENGMIRYNLGNGKTVAYKNIPNKNSISHNDVRDFIIEANGNLWIATWGGGLDYFDYQTNTFTNFSEDLQNKNNTLNNNNIISLEKDGDKIWMATFGGGLNVYDKQTKQFNHFVSKENDSTTLSGNYIFSLLKDSKNNLWVGTSGDGINRIDLKTNNVERFSGNEDIQFGIITSIVEDDAKNIWFGSKDGIIKFDYSSATFNRFSALKGEFHINSVYKDNEGFLYFGGIDGVLKFHPNNIKGTNAQPKAKLTGFKLYNKEVEIDEEGILKKNIELLDKITLEHDHDVITFEFSAMEFPFSTNCEYAIKMENFDKDWRSIGKLRTATYTNLSPGDYTFKIKSRLLGNDWGNESTSIKVVIQKPFWLEWWAFLIYGLVVIFSFYIFRKYIIAWEKMKSNLELERLTHEKDVEVYNLKQQFFTNISHEIRTPVTLILGAINRLLQVEGMKEPVQGSIKTLKKNSSHLLSLVNEVLDYRKLEINEIGLKVTNENWVAFCEEVYLSFSEIARQKNINFSFKTSNSEMMLWFDKGQMDKVLFNLLSNAFKFTPEGKSIDMILLDEKDYVSLTIKDKGIGISKNQISKIFNRFYQSDTTGNIRSKGFGLGLSITKEIIALHHGDIEVHSNEGEGTAFTVTLKKGKNHFKDEELGGNEFNAELIENYFIDKPEMTQKVHANSNSTKDKTLLVVEDNKDIRAYVVSLLMNEYHVLEANDGMEGLQIAKKEVPDLIISDIMMPNMNGIVLTTELKSNLTTSHIPVILLTARALFAHQMEGFNIGADDYITKPFNEELLRARIKNLIKNRALLYERFRSEEIVAVSELTKNKIDQEFLEKLGVLIEKYMDSDSLKASFVAQELGMSHSVVYKKLKMITNMSLVEYVRDYKLKTAKRLLKEKVYNVAEVAYHVGYSDRKYFSKLFKQRFGENPSDFLKK